MYTSTNKVYFQLYLIQLQILFKIFINFFFKISFSLYACSLVFHIYIYIYSIRLFYPSDSSLTIWSLGQLASFPQQSKQGAVARSAKIIWDSLTRRAEQQLTRVKVDIIRCHSHFLPKTQWIFPHFSSRFLLFIHPRRRRWKKRFPFLMRLDSGAFYDH